MAGIDHAPPPFFKRGPAPLALLTLYIALSLAIFVVDLRFRSLDLLRQSVSLVVDPVQRVAQTPGSLVDYAAQYLQGLRSLQQENDELRHAKLNPAPDLQRLQQLEAENERLRKLLAVKEREKAKGQVAQILYTARDPFSRKVILNKGSQQDIEPGSPVVDPQGVIGQVTRVFPLHAEVTLLSDKEQAIPVLIERSGLRAVMFGSGNGLMELKFLAANAEVKPGDRIVTSGLDGVFVPGLPVATVLRVARDNAESFARILCRPIGTVERSGAVLVLGRPEPRPQRPLDDDPNDPQRASAGRIHLPAASVPAQSEPAATASPAR